jgi:hypothetical protein
MKTSELTNVALDWAVAKAEGVDEEAAHLFHGEGYYNYSTDWAQAGPIIERDRITVRCIGRNINGFIWDAGTYGNDEEMEGPTPLIAAMRCYVASKLGDEVEIPGGLMNEAA